MQLSVWEKESFYASCDIVIAGGGFTGLWAALYLKRRQPDLRITIIEKGNIPHGASTRNAGFACYGSATELLSDLRQLGQDRMLSLVEMRYRGIRTILSHFSPEQIDYHAFGGYELLRGVAPAEEVADLNRRVRSIFSDDNTFRFADEKLPDFGIRGMDHLLYTPYEGQLHPGKLSLALLQLVQPIGVVVLPATEIQRFEESTGGVIVHTTGFSLRAGKLLICTNGFARQLLPEVDIVPARGQVLLTAPIPSLSIKGCFHFDEGFYYFRNLGNRLLLGGARNTAIEEETTAELETTVQIQTALENFMNEHLLPDTTYTITDRWSGIMGMGTEKFPLVQQLSANVYCAVRMSGMGVALAPIAAEKITTIMLG